MGISNLMVLLHLQVLLTASQKERRHRKEGRKEESIKSKDTSIREYVFQLLYKNTLVRNRKIQSVDLGIGKL
jgi:hypothetical protein